MQDPLDSSWNRALAATDKLPSGSHEEIDLAALVDFSQINDVFASYLEVIGLPVAIIDLQGQVLASSRWQCLCMDFHRANSCTLARCLESDTCLSSQMQQGKEYAIYRCGNGLTDCAAPIIIEGQHIANLFIGQFFLHPPDLAEFERQCTEFGFEHDDYFRALAEVPVVDEEKIPAILRMLVGFAHQIANQSLAEHRALTAFANIEQEVIKRTQELAENERKYAQLFANMTEGVALHEMVRDTEGRAIDYRIIDINQAFEHQTGLSAATARNQLASQLYNTTPAPYLDDFELVARTGTPSSFETYFAPLQRYFDISVFASGKDQFATVFLDISERKQAEETLRYSEQRFRDVSEAAGEYVWEMGANMVYTYVSERSVDVKGYSPEELLGHTPMAFMHEADIIPVGRTVNTAIANKAPFKLQHRDIARSGAILWEEVSGTPILDRDGNVVGLRGTGLNITERMRTEEALKQSEATFRSMAETVPLAIYVSTGIEQTCEYVNPRFVELFGYTREEVPTVNDWWPLAYPDDDYRLSISQEWQRKVKHALDTQSEIEPMEVVVTCKNGSKRDISWGFITMGEKNYAFGLDLSRRKTAETSLRKLSQAVEQAGESIMITDSLGIIEYVNPAFTTLTGYTAEEALGKAASLLKSGNQDPLFYKEMWETIASGAVWQGKVIDKTRDNNFYPVMLTISPIKNESGEITNYVGIQQNLSDYESLERQFQQAQKMEAIGTLVGGIAHDFNNLLAGITGNLYLAKKHSTNNPDVLKKLTVVETLSFHAAELIKQLLTFARKGPINVRPLPLTPFIKESLKLLHSSIPENITLNIDICSESLMINGDATQLHQILMNLVNNAYDAVEGVDAPCITVRLSMTIADDSFIEHHRELQPGAYAHLRVEDNGCGIRAEQIGHLFEPFFTTKDQGKGTGLGLAMVFGAIQTHHGHIEVDSRTGEGTTFHVYLPLIETTETEILLPLHGEIDTGHGEWILLADDEKPVREAGKNVLESLGYHVMEACDGLQAIELFCANQDRIRLIITDIVMPKLGGVKAIEEIKRINPEVKVIFVTGYDKKATMDTTALSRATILSKPYSIEELGRTIKETLSA